MGRVRMRSQDTIHPSEVRKRILRAALPAALLVSLIMKPVPAFSGGGSRAEMILIPAGKFMMGNTPEEREYGYRLDECLHNSPVARQNQWFEIEQRREVELPTYRIDKYLVSNEDYQEFVNATGHPAPFVTSSVWSGYGLIHKYAATKHFLWRAGRFPTGGPPIPSCWSLMRTPRPIANGGAAAKDDHCGFRPKPNGRRRPAGRTAGISPGETSSIRTG